MTMSNRSFRKRRLSIGILALNAILVLFSSCQKIVNIDLNSSAPKYVIEGVITDSTGPFHVQLTRSGSYFNQPILPPVSDAVIIISDDKGNTDTLKEKQAGLYFTSKISGIPGYNYSLKVITDNNQFEASTSMKSHVNIDSLSVEKTQGTGGKLRLRVMCHFHDPANEKNYYRIKFYTNGKSNSDNYRLYDDQYTNGEKIDFRAGGVELGDTAVVELMSIDKKAFDYFHTLDEILRTNPFFGSTPANPNTNLTNGALGYFAAYAVSFKSIIIR